VENGDKKFESVYSTKLRAGKRRTYFFDVRKTKGDDFYITLTESTKKFDGNGYERHKIFLYKEDFNRFVAGIQDAVNHVKTELMPDYDYEEFERRQAEWEAKRAEEDALAAAEGETKEAPKAEETTKVEEAPKAEETTTSDKPSEESSGDDDMSW